MMQWNATWNCMRSSLHSKAEIMNIAIIGYGRLGREIAARAEATGIQVSSIIDPSVPNAYQEISEDALQDVDVCIDVSHPDVVLTNLEQCCALNCNVVIGTTGWYDRIGEVRTMVEEAGIGAVWASNFLLGMHAFSRIVEHAGAILNALPAFDAAIHETHHVRKVDAPSGTALILGQKLLAALPRKTRLVKGIVDPSDREASISITSTRVGDVPGIHVITFDGGTEQIQISHTVRGRDGFAEGAMAAAAWIAGRTGLFSMEDMLNETTNL